MANSAFFTARKTTSILKSQTFFILLLLIVSVPSLVAQNVGIGTETPGQKLEVAGNIKLGDNFMVEGSEDLRVYRNLASYSPGAVTPGAFVIHTNIERSYGCMWAITIKGYEYNSAALFEVTVGGYNLTFQDAYLYSGDFQLDVRMGYTTADDNIVIILGSEAASYGWPQLTVTECRIGHCAGDETRAEGWSITQETSLAAYSDVVDVDNATDSYWLRNGEHVYYEDGNVGVGTDTPGQKLEVDGNIKVGDNLLVEGTTDYTHYENVASYTATGNNTAGAFAIITNQPTGTIWRMHVEGFLKEGDPIIDMVISGSTVWGDYSGYMSNSSRRMDVHVTSSDSGKIVLLIGDTNAVYDYPKLRVSSFTQMESGLGEAYADGWSIERRTSAMEFGILIKLNDETYNDNLWWGASNDRIFYSEGDVGINYNTPEHWLHIRSFEGNPDDPLLLVENMPNYGTDSAYAIRGVIRSNETTYTGAAIHGLHNNTGGASAGIIGESESSVGTGIIGLASSATGVNYGIFGKTNSAAGFAGYFTGGKNYFAGNVGIGTDSPGQKLQVDGNIKMGDNLMIEGNETLKVYRNLASYYSGSTTSAGAFVIHTNMPGGSVWSMKITGHIWGNTELFEITVGGNNHNMNLCYTYDGSMNIRVRAAVDGSGKMVVILGEVTDSYNYPNLRVSELRNSFGSMLESYADGWSITQESSLAAYSVLTDATDVTQELWSKDGTNIYFDGGNVGIGTTSPTEKLHVAGNILMEKQTPFFDLNALAGTLTSGFNFNYAGSSVGWIFYDHSNDLLKLTSDGVGTRSDFIISDAGNVGIGLQNPSYKLHVTGTVKSGDDFITASGNGVINVGGGINTNANVITDVTNPTLTYATGDEELHIGGDLEVLGGAYKTGGGTWSTLSDRRMKKNVSSFTDGLEQLLQIDPVTYQYNGNFSPEWDNGKTYIGIVAQDIQKIAPYMVEEVPLGRTAIENEDGSETVIDPGTPFLTFDGTALTYMLINSIKEQQKIIEEQQKAFIEQQKQIEDLSKKVDRLLQKIQQ